MHVGYVSDADYVALSDVRVEFAREGSAPNVVQSTASGGIYAELPPDDYRITLAKDGFGSVRVTKRIDQDTVHQFRLLRDAPLGYMTPLAVQSGDIGTYRIHAPEEVQVSLWRYGREKERIAILDWHGEHGPGSTRQRLPQGDFTQTGCEWVSKNPSSPVHAEHVTAPTRSGLYYVHLHGQHPDHFFAFPWVVAPKKPTARFAVLASTMTWNAYNNFGGRSNYVNPDRLPAGPIVDPHAELRRYQDGHRPYEPPNDAYRPLSYERPNRMTHIPAEVRPTDPVAGRNQCHLAPAEWRCLAWLESEGYEYDLYADDHLHDRTLDLDAYEMLLIHTHPEYWSVRMYDRVKTWVEDRGGKLAYLGGNGINCAVEVVDRHRLRYLTHDGAVGGDGYESRFARIAESEANLLGVRFTETGIMSAAPYEVVDANHWIFDGLVLEAGDRVGLTSLQERCSGGASGHETDKRSGATPEETKLLARGTNPDGGGAELVYRTTDSGGAVFSTGSITYPLALFTDASIAQMTRTLLDRWVD